MQNSKLVLEIFEEILMWDTGFLLFVSVKSRRELVLEVDYRTSFMATDKIQQSENNTPVNSLSLFDTVLHTALINKDLKELCYAWAQGTQSQMSKTTSKDPT